MVDRKLGLNHSDLSVQPRLMTKVDYTQEDERIYIGTIPANSTIMSIEVMVMTAFDSGTSDHIEVGTLGDQDAYCADTDVSSAGAASVTLTAASRDITSNTDVYVTHDGAGAAATAGECIVAVHFEKHP